MSLLIEKVKTVMEFDHVTKANIALAPDSWVSGGANYIYYSVKAEVAAVGVPVVLLDEATNLPVDCSNAIICSALFTSGPALTADTTTYFSLGGLSRDLSTFQEWYPNVTASNANNGHFYDNVDNYASSSYNYSGNEAHPIAAIQAFDTNSNPSVPTGTIHVKIVVARY